MTLSRDATPLAPGIRNSSGRNRRNGIVVAYQGERGSNGDLAIDVHWGASIERLGYREFGDAIEAVVRGEADAAVLPVHNAVIGDIPGVGSLLAAAPLRTVGHVAVDVMHCLLGVPGSSLTSVATAFSHPAALSQCSRFFGRHPGITARADYDTAGAAKRVAREGNPLQAAIAPAGCAARYGLTTLAEGIADIAANRTRFVVVERAMG